MRWDDGYLIGYAARRRTLRRGLTLVGCGLMYVGAAVMGTPIGGSLGSFGTLALIAAIVHTLAGFLVLAIAIIRPVAQPIDALINYFPSRDVPRANPAERMLTRLELLGYCLPRRIRARVYTPVVYEIWEDYLLARRMRRSRAQKRWLAFCFTLRTGVAVVQSLRAWGLDSLARGLLRLFPSPIRDWWLGQERQT